MYKSSIAKIPISRLPRGLEITGGQQRATYTIEQKLTDFPLGTVYIYRQKRKQGLLMIGEPTKQLLGMLLHLQGIRKAQDHRLGPSFIDVDYWKCDGGESYVFYASPLPKGSFLQSMVGQEQKEFWPLFIYQLLEQVEGLHRQGYVLGVIRPEQVLLRPSRQVQLYPIFGLLKKGEYKQWPATMGERSYWALGGRQALPEEDLFSLVLLFLKLNQPSLRPLSQSARGQLLEEVSSLDLAIEYRQCLLKALSGKYKTASQMKKEWLSAMQRNGATDLIRLGGYQPRLKEITGILLSSLAYLCCSFFLF